MIDHRIAMMGRSPNILGEMARGTQLAGMANEVNRTNQLQNIFREQGPGIMSGDPTAMNALASFDPMMATNIQTTQAENRRADTRLGMAQEELQMLRDKVARELAAAEDQAKALQEAQEAERYSQRLVAAYASGDEATWAQGTRELFGQPLPRNEDGLAVLGMTYQGVKTYLDALPKNEGPLSPAGKLAADLAAGRITQDQYDAAVRGTPLVDFSGANIGGTGGQGGVAGGVTDALENPPPGAQEAFGLEGFLKGGANTVTDFLGLGEVFPNAAEQTRFFKNLEEDMLVGLSQAYGRQPAQQLMERLRSLLPNAGTVEGANRAFGELTQMERRFQSDLATAQRMLASNPRMNQSDMQQLRARVSGLEATLARIGEAKKRFAAPGSGATISPDVAERMKAYE